MYVDEDGAGDGEGAADVGGKVGLVGDDDGGDVVSGGDFGQVGNGEAGGGVAADGGLAEVAGLGGADGGVTVVVEDEELDWELEAGSSFQLLNVELEAAVAIDEDGAAAAGGDGDGERRRQAEAHGSEAGGVVDALAVAGGTGEEEDLNAAAGAAGDEKIFSGGFCADDFSEMEDGDFAVGVAVLGGDYWVAGFPVGAAGEPGVAVLRGDGGALAEELGEERFGVGADGLLDVGVELGELGGVDVDGDFVGFAGEVLGCVAGDGEVEADADGEEEVRVLEGKVGAASGDGSGAADVGGIAGGNEIGGAPGGNGGDVEELAELGELGLGVGETDAVAGEEQRALGGVEAGD